jgi:hypothetical protein
MPYRVGGRATLVVFAIGAAGTAVGTGLLLYERVQGRDPGRQFQDEIKSFSLLMPFSQKKSKGSKEG